MDSTNQLLPMPRAAIMEFLEQIKRSTPPLNLLREPGFVEQLRVSDIAAYIGCARNTLYLVVANDKMSEQLQRQLSWFIVQWNSGELEKVKVGNQWMIRRRDGRPQAPPGTRRHGIDINAPGGPRLKINGGH